MLVHVAMFSMNRFDAGRDVPRVDFSDRPYRSTMSGVCMRVCRKGDQAFRRSRKPRFLGCCSAPATTFLTSSDEKARFYLAFSVVQVSPGPEFLGQPTSPHALPNSDRAGAFHR